MFLRISNIWNITGIVSGIRKDFRKKTIAFMNTEKKYNRKNFKFKFRLQRGKQRRVK